MQKLIDIPGTDPALADVLAGGLYTSLPAKQTKLWLTGTNVRFVDKGVEKAKGIELLASVTEPITGVAQAYVEGERRAYFGTPTIMYKYSDGDTGILRSGFTNGRWSMIPWGEWLLATNNTEKPQIWKNTGSMVDWANVPVTKARIVRKLAERPILFAGQTAYWPRATDIEYWATPDPEGRAGSMFIRDLDSDITAVEPLGELLAYYTLNEMGLVTFVGGQAVYGFKNRLEGIGAIGINAIIPVGQIHYGMSLSGIWRADGSSQSYFDDPAVNRYLDTTLDKDRGDEVVGVHIKDRKTVEWHYPGVDEEVHCLGYNYGNGSWHHLMMGVTAAGAAEIFDYPIAASANEWGLYDKTDDIGSATMVSELRSGGFDAGNAHHFKWWDKVEVYREGVGTLEIRFGLHKTETMGATNEPGAWVDYWTEWTPLARENYIQAESVYLTLELRSVGANTSWRMGGLSVWGELAGRVS